MITVPAGRYDGYIFDLDGTLADSMPVHFEAWTETLERKGGVPSRFTEERFYAFAGRSAREIVASLNREEGYELPVEETAREKEARFLEILERVPPIEPVVEFARDLGPNAKRAVASGGLRRIVERTLEVIGARGLFAAVVASDEVERGKPAPDMFLKAADLLGAQPHRCLVLEDGPPGFRAARSAGMDFLDVRPYYMPPARWEMMRQFAPVPSGREL
jgi:HAD superfamily hydrolase (TIGR01509 family)